MRKIFGFLAVIFLTSMLFAGDISCANDNGSCQFNEDGSYECLCSSDSYGDGMGIAGSGSDGEVTMPTQEECLEMIDEMCALPEGAVACENPAGECVVLEDGDYWCDCYDGSSSGEGESEPGNPGEEPSVDPDETDSEEVPPSLVVKDETEPAKEECESDADCEEGLVCWDGYCYAKDSETPEKQDPPECEALLKETCGTEAPDLNDICSEDALDFCADGMAVYMKKCEDEEIPAEMMEEIKNGTWNDLGSDVAECCQDYSNIKDEMTTFIDCLKTKPCEECEKAYSEAVGEYDDEGDSGSQSGDDTADSGDTANEDGADSGEEAEDPKGTSSSDSSDGCSMTLI
jgi:hypothetical protein